MVFEHGVKLPCNSYISAEFLFIFELKTFQRKMDLFLARGNQMLMFLSQYALFNFVVISVPI